MQEDARAIEDVGVQHVAVRLGGATAAESVERIERFGAEVIAKMRG